MSLIPVSFRYLVGLNHELLRNVRLCGSWDANGVYSDQWTTLPMAHVIAEDGCPSFTAVVPLNTSEIGKQFSWGLIVDAPNGNNSWGIPTEVQDVNSNRRTRSFVLSEATRTEEQRYYLTSCRNLGAQKFWPPGATDPALRFAVWAPDASAASVVFGGWQSGYIGDNGEGINTALKEVPLRKKGAIWESTLADSPQLARFADFDHVPFMFKVQTDGGDRYRTDLHSRCQIGSGPTDPNGQAFAGPITQLTGRVSCSVVVDPDTVTAPFKEAEWPEDKGKFVPADEFWKHEFDTARPLPTRLEDLVIYELHVGSLGFGRPPDQAGTFEDAIKFLEQHLMPLGINAVELLPIAEFGGGNEWGYGNTHHFALEFRCGGRDQFKHFVRECHRRGIAVILDVVYNHFHGDADRAEWLFDSDQPELNRYYWYEGRSADYPHPDGGYLDNGSTGYLPRLWEETVRQIFISSAAALVDEFHVDGFRVDLTQALHRDNVLHVDNRVSVGSANIFGQKLLREWSRTLKMIRPSVFLIAEDHTGWDKVTQSPEVDGLGFDATWYADFYHNLVGTEADSGASLIARAGFGAEGRLEIDAFAGALAASPTSKIVYHISHDEAGNSFASHRTMVTAVHGAANVEQIGRAHV